MLVNRQHENGEPGGEDSAMVPSDQFDALSAVYRFVEAELPKAGLRAELLPFSSPNAANLVGLRFYRVHQVRAKERSTSAPLIASPEERYDMGQTLATAWGRARLVGGAVA